MSRADEEQEDEGERGRRDVGGYMYTAAGCCALRTGLDWSAGNARRLWCSRGVWADRAVAAVGKSVVWRFHGAWWLFTGRDQTAIGLCGWPGPVECARSVGARRDGAAAMRDVGDNVSQHRAQPSTCPMPRDSCHRERGDLVFT